MSEQEHESKSEKFIYMGVGVACFIGAIIVGRLVGFLGIGAIALGWVAFTFSRDKVGIFLGILVGFADIFLMVKSELGIIAAAAAKNAAEDGSPGIVILNLFNDFVSGGIIILSPTTCISTPKYLSINSEWSLDFIGSTISTELFAPKAANIIADFTCALAIGIV